MSLFSRLLLSFMALAPISAQAVHQHYVLDPKVSSVNFSTIKLQYFLEPAKFEVISGNINADGEFKIDIDLSSVDTGVKIRNQRVSDLFFKTDEYPKAMLTGTIDLAEVSALTEPTIKEVKGKLEFYGSSKSVKMSLLVVNTPQYIAVSTVSPVVVNAVSFGVPNTNLEELAKTVGGIPISPAVAVNAALVFKRK
ncbi:conserved hypothetical protein [Vibrio nigripulchritudo SFn27]|uniref:Lipid/polyisoprenoid-binding YceI-like domain-containing protein n=1 Tax=Vibrio nigripulchritudo TaxID=28173 RepID=U4KH64_9VIBR|nr:YceI family protein [Vibrio nigripulchritudo]CCN81615.1 conserved hypothetical protein [Vibrio nigripulchritudo BLFn1]CCN91712.1 conserved hypothetical protein [Vibrio nigripulchritudo SFn27]CCN96596.1 conserved hypothetical protein [Vibrio nigripulchritudo ENn2]CCO38470.1 conserved hypothetical protein [Vibrio nigripulchritudo SFn135]CCO53927.1 conserved hypothetical protein [Vibrio nigripulchritudo Wn13]